jgi:hypothetical protein
MDNTEGNKLIADFMGHGFEELTDNEVPHRYYMIKGVGYKDALLKYHTSWDWLMPVVEKIKDVQISEGWSNKQPVINALSDVNITILWKAVVQFIQWYNKKQSNG